MTWIWIMINGAVYDVTASKEEAFMVMRTLGRAGIMADLEFHDVPF
jgi:hypothetical protein